ncbi:hypothetical protein B0H16DRAFT_1765419 [Mycena metata]|uniref:Uncharacterized protein n=1 Tax=Mycena metata TaxID=1033252 RepID=A0AAD7I694_9AGAR|nr:hypothetical protein B0H16DRAFT_1765419 [Mycena metata]
MSDPTRCRAKDSDGEQCICIRPEDVYIGPDKRHYCRNCDHITSAHPQENPPPPGRRPRQKPVLAFAPKCKSDTKPDSHQEPATKKNKAGQAKGKGKQKQAQGEEVKFSKLVLLPCGLFDDGTIWNNKVPPEDAIQDMCHAGLVILSTPQNPLSINTMWDNGEVQEEILRLFPHPLAWLDRHAPPDQSGEQQWLGAIVHKGIVTLARDAHPTGVEIADYCKKAGRGPTQRELYIGKRLFLYQRTFT